MFNGQPEVTTAVVGNNTRIVPSAVSVTVAVNLGVSQLYVSVQLSQKQSVVQLMSAIIGLAGILGAFASAFGVTERYVFSRFQKKAIGEGGAAVVAPVSTAGGVAESGVINSSSDADVSGNPVGLEKPAAVELPLPADADADVNTVVVSLPPPVTATDDSESHVAGERGSGADGSPHAD